MPELGFNKVCELEDFENPELVEIIRDVFRHEIRDFAPDFPKGAEYRKYWEIAMSVRAFRHFGVLNRKAVVLGVGAGTETTLFYLTQHTRQVIATDLYMDPGNWDYTAPSALLLHPEQFAPYEFDRNRLLVIHMDGRVLRFPDETFDGIFSSGSIEHFGDWNAVGNAAYEMGRVLKPGGILTLSTEYRISGPPGGIGWEGCLLFSPDEIIRYVVEASGLEWVDEFRTEVSDRTLQTNRDLTLFARDVQEQSAQGIRSIRWSHYPHLLLVHAGYVFGSVHLTLRKTERYPAKPNDWAKPTLATIDAVNERSRFVADEIMRRRSGPEVAPQPAPLMPQTPETTPSSPIAVRDSHKEIGILTALRNDWETLRAGGQHTRVPRIPFISGMAHFALRLLHIGRMQVLHTQMTNALLELQSDFDTRLYDLQAQAAILREQTQQIEARQLRPSSTCVQTYATRDRLGNPAALVTENALRSEFDRLAARVEQIEAGEKIEQMGVQFNQRATHLQEQIRLNTSQIRWLTQQIETPVPVTLPTPPCPEDIVEWVQTLEGQVPEVRTHAVDFSIQGSAEAAVLACAAYFGSRLSSQAGPHPELNNTWYHFDWSSEWSRPVLFESAVKRLSVGGKFVLMTAPEHQLKENPRGLELMLEKTISTRAGQAARVFIWSKP